jgi:hypothetical protein
MAIISEKIENHIINVIITSSNLKMASYNTLTEELTITFNNNATYKYDKVPWPIFTKMRMSESQGKFFNEQISKKFTYTKVS